MPRDKKHPSPHERAGFEAINVMVARTAPPILEPPPDGGRGSGASTGGAPPPAPKSPGLPGAGGPPPGRPIVGALAGRHAGDDVVHPLTRLAVTGQVVETGGKYTPATASEP